MAEFKNQEDGTILMTTDEGEEVTLYRCERGARCRNKNGVIRGVTIVPGGECKLCRGYERCPYCNGRGKYDPAEYDRCYACNKKQQDAANPTSDGQPSVDAIWGEGMSKVWDTPAPAPYDEPRPPSDYRPKRGGTMAPGEYAAHMAAGDDFLDAVRARQAPPPDGEPF